MNALDLKFPDFSKHPPPPKLSFEQYQRWVFEEIVPELARCGQMTPSAVLADFMRNEGRQTEPWPDFGSLSDAANAPIGSQTPA
ncbi:MAG: hypothetical protein WCJ66_07095 [Verrucomicrobiota bacterium]